MRTPWVVCRHPWNKQTKVGARNEVVNVDPGTVDASRRVDVTRDEEGELPPLLSSPSSSLSYPLLCACSPLVSSLTFESLSSI